MITFSLAMSLKNAGFPQSKDDGSHAGRYLFPPGVTEIDENIHENAAYAPTLEELLLACDDQFDALFRNRANYWVADSSSEAGFSCTGPTPSDAVAYLWLALKSDGQPQTDKEIR